MFVVHGNILDFMPLGTGAASRYGQTENLLAEQLFGRWNLVLYYDLARGLRCLGGTSPDRQREMSALMSQQIGDIPSFKRDPTVSLAAVDRFIDKMIVAEPGERHSMALLVNHASLLVPRGEGLSQQSARHLVTLLNWAQSPYVKRQNLCFVLMDTELGRVSERIAGNPHIASIEVSLPTREVRWEFLQASFGNEESWAFSDFSSEQLATMAAGLSLTDLDVLVRSSIENERRLTRERFSQLKKRLIERQAQGLLEFVEARWSLDDVVGHDAAKARLRADAELIVRGHVDSVPMGYLVCGPVGTGKTFLAQCMAGSIGIPCVVLKNFRSKYVGETEGNLQRVLTVLRSMGPVVVVIDEADAMLGDREQGGDSGVSSRVFGAIATQMGDTRYRGRILWMLLTARPDHLPIDLKRQGRAEVHIPLFYPQTQQELRAYFPILARKIGAQLDEAAVPDNLPYLGQLSGADVESLLGRAWRSTLLAGNTAISAETLARVCTEFLPSTQTLEKEAQELAAIIECTDREFLPPSMLERIDTLGGRAQLARHLQSLKARI